MVSLKSLDFDRRSSLWVLKDICLAFELYLVGGTNKMIIMEEAKNTKCKVPVTNLLTIPLWLPVPELENNDLFFLTTVDLGTWCSMVFFETTRSSLGGSVECFWPVFVFLILNFDKYWYVEWKISCTMSRLKMYPVTVDHRSTVNDNKYSSTRKKMKL